LSIQLIYYTVGSEKPRTRGFHLVTDEILQQLPELTSVGIGIMNIFMQHTSASLTLNENADPTVRQDFEDYFNHAVPEDAPYYRHMNEGSDDLPAHLKSSLLGSSLTIPITHGRLNLGYMAGDLFVRASQLWRKQAPGYHYQW
jgi:secondary thiamine-phosphate synthase enzyme